MHTHVKYILLKSDHQISIAKGRVLKHLLHCSDLSYSTCKSLKQTIKGRSLRTLHHIASNNRVCASHRGISSFLEISGGPRSDFNNVLVFTLIFHIKTHANFIYTLTSSKCIASKKSYSISALCVITSAQFLSGH